MSRLRRAINRQLRTGQLEPVLPKIFVFPQMQTYCAAFAAGTTEAGILRRPSPTFVTAVTTPT